MNKNLFIKILLIITLLIPSRIYAEGIKISCSNEVYPGSTVPCQIFLDGVDYGVDTFEAGITLSDSNFTAVSFNTDGFGSDINGNHIDNGYETDKTNNDLLGTLNIKVGDGVAAGDRCMLKLDVIVLYSNNGLDEHSLSSVSAMLEVKEKSTSEPDEPNPSVDPDPGTDPEPSVEPDPGTDPDPNNGNKDPDNSVEPGQSGGNSNGTSNNNQNNNSSNPKTGVSSILAITILMIVALFGAYHFFANTKNKNN